MTILLTGVIPGVRTFTADEAKQIYGWAPSPPTVFVADGRWTLPPTVTDGQSVEYVARPLIHIGFAFSFLTKALRQTERLAWALFRTDRDVEIFALEHSERDAVMRECTCGGCDLPQIRSERYIRTLHVMRERDELGLWTRAWNRAVAILGDYHDNAETR